MARARTVRIFGRFATWRRFRWHFLGWQRVLGNLPTAGRRSVHVPKRFRQRRRRATGHYHGICCCITIATTTVGGAAVATVENVGQIPRSAGLWVLDRARNVVSYGVWSDKRTSVI